MKKQLSIFLFLCQFPFLNFAQNFKQPKIVIGIVVDQMRSDYIYRYWSKLSDDGFKRLIREGFECKNVQYNYIPTLTSPGHASIYTGTTPAVHGIIGNNWFDPKVNAAIYAASDSAVHNLDGIGGMSPKHMLTTTIGDELMLFNNFRSKVIGISLKDRGAIFPAGKSGMAYWLEDNSLRFTTSTYYLRERNPVLSKWVIDFNNRKLPQAYLDSVWSPLYEIKTYTESTSDSNRYEEVLDVTKGNQPVFPYDLKKLKDINVELLRNTPFGDNVLKEFAIAAIEGENLGKDSICDMLLVSFSSPDEIGHSFATHAIETEDTYLRFDLQLSSFLKYLDGKIGKDNFILFLTADHGVLPNPVLLNDHQLPGGFIETNMMTDTLRYFFRTNYSDASLFKYYMNEQVWLNSALVKSKGLDKQKITENLGRYLMKLDIVADVLTRSQLEQNEYVLGRRSLVQKGFNYKRSGDLAIIFQPGFVKTSGPKTGTNHGSPYKYDTSVPLIWYGWNVKPGSTARQINITDIAATVSVMLNICQPSACEGFPIEELVK